MSLKPMQNPEDMPERFKQAWNSYNAPAIAELFSENPDFVNVTGKWWEEKSEIQKAHDFGFQMIFSNSHLEILKIKKKMLKEDIAIIHSRIRVTGQTENQVEKTDKRETMFLFVMKKHGEFWLCESAQNTDIIFGMQTNIRDEKGNLKAVSYKEKTQRITRDLNEE